MLLQCGHPWNFPARSFHIRLITLRWEASINVEALHVPENQSIVQPLQQWFPAHSGAVVVPADQQPEERTSGELWRRPWRSDANTKKKHTTGNVKILQPRSGGASDKAKEPILFCMFPREKK